MDSIFVIHYSNPTQPTTAPSLYQQNLYYKQATWHGDWAKRFCSPDTAWGTGDQKRLCRSVAAESQLCPGSLVRLVWPTLGGGDMGSGLQTNFILKYTHLTLIESFLVFYHLKVSWIRICLDKNQCLCNLGAKSILTNVTLLEDMVSLLGLLAKIKV